jgi:hypothetical protein
LNILIIAAARASIIINKETQPKNARKDKAGIK